MYCIKCSMLLIKENNHFFCSSGFLEYSIHLSETIEKLYVSKNEKQNGFMHTGHYFCPQCGKQMKSTECIECNISIKPLIYELIEFHPHNSHNGRYF